MSRGVPARQTTLPCKTGKLGSQGFRIADPGPEPADPADGGAFRLPGEASCYCGSDRQREAGAPEAGAVAEPDRRRAARLLPEQADW